MKKWFITALAAIAFAPVCMSGKTASATAEGLTSCKAAYLCDYESGICAYSENETERRPIASMCKIMTLLLCFEAAESGELSFDEQIAVGENAAGMGGSQVFLGSGLSYPAEQLMKSIAVCSANDSCVAMAERIAGSESLFVEKMNARAKELGAENTLFANCTGLPKDPQYSCAKDVALMLRELLTHQKYFEFSKVWLEDFVHPDGRTTTMTNTNKLIRFYEGCDGGKTGFTNEAGFCLAATAKRGDTRLLAVVIGADSSENRFQSVKNLFQYAFSAYESRKIVEAGKPLETKLCIRGGKQKEISVCPADDLTLFCKRGEEVNASTRFTLAEGTKAPLQAGADVGEIVLFRDGVEAGRCKLLAAESVEKLSYGDAFREIAGKW